MVVGYVDGTIPCPDQLNATTTGKETVQETNPNYTVWIANGAHVHMLLLSTICQLYLRLPLYMFKALHLEICGFLLSVLMLHIHLQGNIH